MREPPGLSLILRNSKGSMADEEMGGGGSDMVCCVDKSVYAKKKKWKRKVTDMNVGCVN